MVKVEIAAVTVDLLLPRPRLARGNGSDCPRARGNAPHAGIVGVGDIVTGNPAQPVVRFCPDETPLVRVEVNQEFADRVKVGQTARVKDDAHGGRSWRGKVRRVAAWFEQRRPTSQDPSQYTDVRTVECLIAIDPGQPPLRIGQRMRVMIGPVTE